MPAKLRPYAIIQASSILGLAHLTRAGLDGLFIHFDADCLDDRIMPAVDYRLKGGLCWREMIVVLRRCWPPDVRLAW